MLNTSRTLVNARDLWTGKTPTPTLGRYEALGENTGKYAVRPNAERSRSRLCINLTSGLESGPYVGRSSRDGVFA